MKTDDFFKTVTEKVISAMEGGDNPFVKPWRSQGIGYPENPTTGKKYTGFNAFWLSFLAMQGSSHLWATYNQWAEAGATVRKGEKGTPVIRPIEIKAKFNEASEQEGEDATRLLFKTYYVFSLDQVEGAEAFRPQPIELKPVERRPDIETAVAKTGAAIVPDLSQCFYRPASDTVHMVDAAAFESIESYYAVQFHELGHWTGAEKRLARDLSGKFKSEAYAAEELIAEMTSAFLCHHFNIDGMDRHHGQYLKSWATVLKNDDKAIFKASGMASKAASFLVPELGK
ncbi:zincin-like metallopeptidase domain-containing protein [Methylobacterium sp. 1030]|uniref:ArdC family protein n=1 Tax=Methylobacterium sp. 1030 TaxID=3156404 RepID=UPI00339A3AE7